MAVGIDYSFHRQDAIGHREILEQRGGGRSCRRRRRLRDSRTDGGACGNGDRENGGRNKTNRPGHDQFLSVSATRCGAVILASKQERRSIKMSPVANVFISYRREDAAGHAGRLCDRLTARFGHARVFMDLQDIAPGQNFAQSIDDTIAACECVVVVIGPRWLESLQKRAHGEDFVQHEIAAALRRAVTIIPVLVGGARMPSADQLPPAVGALSYRNALEVRDDRFDEDASRLVDAVSAHVPVGSTGGGLLQSSRARVAAAVLAVAVLVGAVAAWRA